MFQNQKIKIYLRVKLYNKQPKIEYALHSTNAIAFFLFYVKGESEVREYLASMLPNSQGGNSFYLLKAKAKKSDD